MSAPKIYCYVDESGQDTEGQLFVVSVVIASHEKQILEERLELIEQQTRKHTVKWSRTAKAIRRAYLERVLSVPELHGRILFAHYRNSKAYMDLTAQTIVNAISVSKVHDYKAVLLIDALPIAQAGRMGALLRHMGVTTKKVRGVRDEESNALIRLADAICGLVRDGTEEKGEMQRVFLQAIERGALIELTPKG